MQYNPLVLPDLLLFKYAYKTEKYISIEGSFFKGGMNWQNPGD